LIVIWFGTKICQYPIIGMPNPWQIFLNKFGNFFFVKSWAWQILVANELDLFFQLNHRCKSFPGGMASTFSFSCRTISIKKYIFENHFSSGRILEKSFHRSMIS
jgi:hypothetical protein